MEFYSSMIVYSILGLFLIICHSEYYVWSAIAGFSKIRLKFLQSVILKDPLGLHIVIQYYDLVLFNNNVLMC